MAWPRDRYEIDDACAIAHGDRDIVRLPQSPHVQQPVVSPPLGAGGPASFPADPYRRELVPLECGHTTVDGLDHEGTCGRTEESHRAIAELARPRPMSSNGKARAS